MLKHYLSALLLLLGGGAAEAAVFYVAPTGLDTNSGTIASPFLTIQRAQTAVVAGDTVYVRGGTYLMQNSQIALHFTSGTTTWSYVTNLTKSGVAGKRINYWAYPGEQPVFDYRNLNPNADTPAGERVNAFEVSASYIHLRGLEVVGVRVPIVNGVNTQSICFSNNRGNNNIYERLSMHDGQAIGFYLTQGVNTLVLNCDAYRNNDNTSTFAGSANGGNVDGFGAHPSSAGGTGNVFRGCRAWQNSDDGYDCINAYAAVTFENCWAFYNGYTQNFVERGDGNGFKAGGYGSTAVASLPATVPSHTVRFCVSVRNRSNGFYSNHHLAGNSWNNNTAYQNGSNYNMVNRQDKTATGYQVDVNGYGHTLRNNISLLARSTNAATRDIAQVNPALCTIENNTFPTIGTNPVAVAVSDFISLDTTQLRAPRQADGSLPIVPLLRLAVGSSLVDAGTTAGFPVGFSYVGAAPDLGAYEYANLWTGATGTDWFASGNWTGGVPTATTDVLIPSVGVARYPLVSTGAATARALTVGTGATLTQSGGTLSLTGNLTNNGTWTATGGTLATSGSASQVLGGSSPLAVQGLTIGAGGATLGTPTSFQGALTLLGNLATNGQKLTLLSSVSGGVPADGLVVNSGGVVTGSATVQRALDPSLNAGIGYRHYSSPVQGATVGDLATTATGGSFVPVVNAAYNTSATPTSVTPFPTAYSYDDSRLSLSNSLSDFNKGFVSPAAFSDVLAVGRGYTLNIAASEVVDFQGTLNTGDKTLTLTSTRPSYADGGWQFLGNPYPAPLDYSLVDPADRAGLDDAIYVYSSSGPYAGQYRSYVNRIGNPVLPMGQGFFVRAATGQATASITFRNSQRLTAPTSTTLQRPTAETRPLVQLTLQGAGHPLTDETTVYFEQGATSGFESAYDAEKLPNPTGLNLSTSQGSRQLSINGQATLGTARRVVPLAVGVPAAGSYTITASQLLNLAGVPMYLHDAQLGTLTDLRQQPTYQFTVANAAALTAARFELLFAPRQALATVPAALAQQVAVYPNPATLAVRLELPAALGRTAATVALVDALGRVARTQMLPAGLVTHTLSLAGVAPGVYSMRLTTELGPVVQKLVVE